MTTALHLMIDNHPHTTKDDDQAASDLIRLAGKDPGEFDLFLIDGHGVEHHIADTAIVNLRDEERFVTRMKIRFTVDGELQSGWDDDLTASAILRRVGLDPAQYDLALVSGHGAPHTFADDDVVHLRNGDEFVTAKRIGNVA
jgi:hypothetical protein